MVRILCLILVEKLHFKYRRMKVAAMFNNYILNFNFTVFVVFLKKLYKRELLTYFGDLHNLTC